MNHYEPLCTTLNVYAFRFNLRMRHCPMGGNPLYSDGDDRDRHVYGDIGWQYP